MIESLQQCPGFDQSPVYVFCEGPRSSDEEAIVQETRAVARELLGDRAVYVEREQNLGLANSIVSGVTTLCDTFGKTIVIEDDLIVAPDFLTFMNTGLEKYADAPKVMHISGYMYDVAALNGVTDVQFMPLMSSWGWATWKRAWDHYDIEATGWQQKLGNPRERWKFDLNGNANHSRMLGKQMAGEIDTWDIQWYYAIFLNGGLGLFPPQSLVRNDGMDGSGTHYTVASGASQQDLKDASPITFPDRVTLSPFRKDVYAELRKLIWRTRLSRIRSKLSSRIAKAPLRARHVD